MTKYQIGDRVRIGKILDGTFDYKKFEGNVGTVTRVSPIKIATYPITVFIDLFPDDHEAFRLDELKAICPTSCRNKNSK